MFKFEWDDQKAASNLQKHGVSFDEAVSAFGDALALTFSDTYHAEVEERSRTYGLSNKERLLVVVHTERRNSIRIISARKATRYEKGIYENRSLPYQRVAKNAATLGLSIIAFLNVSFASNMAYASSQYFSSHAHVICCFLPQVTQTGPTGVYPGT